MDVLRESRQAAPNHEKADSLLKTVHNLRRTTSASYLHIMNQSDETATHACQCLNQSESWGNLFSCPISFVLIAMSELLNLSR